MQTKANRFLGALATDITPVSARTAAAVKLAVAEKHIITSPDYYRSHSELCYKQKIRQVFY